MDAYHSPEFRHPLVVSSRSPPAHQALLNLVNAIQYPANLPLRLLILLGSHGNFQRGLRVHDPLLFRNECSKSSYLLGLVPTPHCRLVLGLLVRRQLRNLSIAQLLESSRPIKLRIWPLHRGAGLGCSFGYIIWARPLQVIRILRRRSLNRNRRRVRSILWLLLLRLL